MYSLKTIARPYAKAVLEIAQEDQSFDKWYSFLEFYSLASKDKRLRYVLSGVLSSDQTMSILSELFQGYIDNKSHNLLKIMADNKNLLALSELYCVYDELFKNLSGKTDVFITSALPLNDNNKTKLLNALEKKLGKSVNIFFEVDNNIIGGLLVKYNDLVIDSSVKNKLFRMKQSLQS